ncbi:phospholipase D-like domain-containing protein [Clostridium sp. HMP27]|uniref:phospholipase D-like domain-containing protein n=1 Tax=Clostridium sp. HMP27 TaxID=1487921 RepID=UPI00052C5D84|nr:phospholipase D-like domain-containing protein [Clostridium sp. HMP27]KGK88590.1 hypothetical protein DP68_06990 [Clostridium sp. HMP27]
MNEKQNEINNIKDYKFSINNAKSFEDAMRIYGLMKEQCINPDIGVINSILSKIKTIDEARVILEEAINEKVDLKRLKYNNFFRNNPFETETLLSELGTNNESYSIYRKLRNNTRNLSSEDKVIKKYIEILKQEADIKNSAKLLKFIMESQLEPNENLIYYILNKATNFEKLLFILNELIKSQINISQNIYYQIRDTIRDEEQLEKLVEFQNKYSKEEHLMVLGNFSNIYKKSNLLDIRNREEIQTNVKDSSEEAQLKAVRENEEAIKYIKEPSINVQLESVKHNLISIKYIDNPFPEVEQEVRNQLMNVNPYLSVQEQLELIRNNSILIKYITKPSEAISLEAVRQNGLLIKYVDTPSLDVQLEAVRHNSEAIQFIDNPDIDVQIEAVRLDGCAIRFINNPSLITQLEAVMVDGYAIKYIENPYNRVQIEVAKQGSDVFQLIKKPSVDAQKEFIKYHPEEILSVNNLSQEVINYYHNTNIKNAVQTDVTSFDEKNNSNQFIKNAILTDKFDITNQNTNINSHESKKNYNIEMLHEELKSRYVNLFNNEEKLDCQFTIINNVEPLNEHIKFLSNKIDIQNLYVASGFVYKSGLKLIESVINNVKKINGKIRLIVGSLQNYNEICKSNDNRVAGMNKETAIYINDLLRKNSIVIRTFERQFYHGKYYFLEGYTKSCVIIGSSNLSISGLVNNRELNMLYVIDNNSKTYNFFKKWFNKFWDECIEINELTVDIFNDINTNYDTNFDDECIKKLQNQDVKEYINELTDEEIKMRLNLWMNKEPDNIYTDLNIDSLKDYVLIEYKKYNLIVLESFKAGNSYYYFKNKTIETLLDTIRYMSKSEIFNLANMSKRGYHTHNSNKLEVNINSLFVKKHKNT